MLSPFAPPPSHSSTRAGERNTAFLDRRISAAWAGFHANSGVLRADGVSEKQRLKLLEALVLNRLCHSIGTTTLLLADIARLNRCYAANVSLTIRRARAPSTPIPIHRILIKRELYTHFSSTNPAEHWTNPSTRYHLDKARLAREVAERPDLPAAQLVKWRPLAEWESSRRTRARSTHRRPGHHTW